MLRTLTLLLRAPQYRLMVATSRLDAATGQEVGRSVSVDQVPATPASRLVSVVVRTRGDLTLRARRDPATLVESDADLNRRRRVR